MANYILREDFIELYGTSVTALQHLVRNEYIPKEVSIRQDGEIYIDIDWFVRRLTFKKKIWLQNHEMYFFLSRAMTDTEIALALQLVTGITETSWRTWLNAKLFALLPSGGIDYKISKRHYLFNRVASWLIRAAFKKLNIPKDKRSLTWH